MKLQLQKAIAQAVNRLQGPTLRPEEIHLEHPENEEYGDYATNVAMTMFAKLKKEILRLPDSSSFDKTQDRHRIKHAQAFGSEAQARRDDTIALKKFSDRVKFKSPLDLAEAIVEELKNNETMKQWGREIKAVKPGFINLSIKNEWFVKELQRVLNDGSNYGKLAHANNKKIMVEYAHPNTHKLFHIGHLRNITNGEAIVRILEANGYKVIRANYQGDVGLHIAKCLWGILHGHSRESGNLYRFLIKPFGSELRAELSGMTLDQKIEFLGRCYVEGNRAYEGDEKAKKEILEINKKIYDQSDSKVKPSVSSAWHSVRLNRTFCQARVNKLWQETRQWSLDYFERIYKRVDSHFDRYYFEGEVYQKGKQIVLEGVKKGIFVKSKGAIIFPGSKYGLHDRVFITGEGNPTYEAKDMELGRLQFEEYKPDLIIHNVAPEQREYFKVVFEALAQIYPYTRGKEYHLIYGWVRLKKGKMSSRMGNVVTGEWLLDEAKRRIKKSFSEVSDQTAEMIAVAAVKYSFLKVSPPQDLAFDFEESISLEGNSGPYLQYTYARAKSVLAKAKSKDLRFKIYDLRINDEEKAILRTLYKFPEVVLEAGENYAPNLICNFLYDLAQKFNTFYNKHRIINATMRQCDNETMEFRLCLAAATAQILKTGLELLGIKAPEKM